MAQISVSLDLHSYRINDIVKYKTINYKQGQVEYVVLVITINASQATNGVLTDTSSV